MNRVVSADWVLPIEGPPIEDGAVAIEDGRIAAVGTADELGEGTRYDDSVIVPGFVNAHSHLEYAVYGGFGDGLGDFAEWIALHIQRKARIGWDEFVDIAKLGAAECLASGVTTVGDCSFSGATAIACAELGLRATVYIEVFGADPGAALERFAEIRDRVSDAFSERVRPGISPHAPYSVSIDVYEACAELGLPIATHISESRSEVAYLLTGEGAWGAYKDLLVDVAGQRRARDCLPSTTYSDQTSSPRTASSSRRTRSACWPRPARASRTVPALERCARLRRRAAGRAPRGRRERRRGYRQPGFGALVRLLRGARMRRSLRAGAGGQA